MEKMVPTILLRLFIIIIIRQNVEWALEDNRIIEMWIDPEMKRFSQYCCSRHILHNGWGMEDVLIII